MPKPLVRRPKAVSATGVERQPPWKLAGMTAKAVVEAYCLAVAASAVSHMLHTAIPLAPFRISIPVGQAIP